jgi:hypothetical protein
MTDTRLRQRVRRQVDERLAELTAAGVIDEAGEAEVDALLEWYCSEYSLAERIERVGERYLVGLLVFFLLQRRDVAYRHDTELYHDAMYGTWLEEYVAISDGVLEGLEYDLDSDLPEGEGVRIECHLDGAQVAETMPDVEYIYHEAFIGMLNGLVAAVSDDDRRYHWTFYSVRPDTTVYVFFLEPAAWEVLERYLAETSVGR